MKLQHLELGARFEYEGLVYVKTGPLTASSAEGGQRVIPRYANLTPLDLPEPETKGVGRGQFSRQTVLAAFNAFYNTCAQWVEDDKAAELESARQRFLASLR